MSARPPRRDAEPMLPPVANHFGLLLEHPTAWPGPRMRAWTVWWAFLEGREAMALAVKTARDLAREGK